MGVQHSFDKIKPQQYLFLKTFSSYDCNEWLTKQTEFNVVLFQVLVLVYL